MGLKPKRFICPVICFMDKIIKIAIIPSFAGWYVSMSWRKISILLLPSNIIWDIFCYFWRPVLNRALVRTSCIYNLFREYNNNVESISTVINNNTGPSCWPLYPSLNDRFVALIPGARLIQRKKAHNKTHT